MDLSEVERFEVKEKYLKVSEAMRIGMGMFPDKCIGQFFDGRYAACALGAIFAGFGYRSSNRVPLEVMKRVDGAQEVYDAAFGRYIHHDNDMGVARETILLRLESLGL